MIKLSEDAFKDAFSELMLAKDLVKNAEYSKWKWSLILSISEALIKSLWAIYFLLKEQRDEEIPS